MKESFPYSRPFLSGLLLGGLCLWWCLRPHPPTPATMPLFDGSDYNAVGETLLHGIPATEDITHRMPLATLLSALLLNHSAVPWPALRNSLWLVKVLLAAAICGLLEGSAAAALAAAAITGFLILTGSSALSELNGSLLMLLAAGMMAWRAQKPSLPRSLALGAAFGAALLTRSTLCLFPPLLALWEWFAARKNSSRFDWRNALVVAVVPYLFLLPWMRLNWNLYHSFVPFEHNAPNLNIVTGVLGLVQTSGGDPRSLVPGLGPMEKGILPWALREIALHPGPFIAGFARRLLFFFQWHPIIISLAALSVYLNRRRSDYLCLGLLGAYYVAIHCTMSVNERYFTSLWPILAILACAPLAAYARRDKPGAAPAGPVARYSGRFLIGAQAFALVFAAYAILRVNAYARIAAGSNEPPRTGDYDRAISRYPHDTKLRLRRGRLRGRAGDLPGAEEDLALAAALQPEDQELSLELAFARALRGDGSSLRDWRMPWSLDDADGRALRQRWRIYQAIACVQRGEERPASDHLRRALILNRHFLMPFVYESASAALIETRIRNYAAGFIGEVLRLSEGRPAAQRLVLVRAAGALLPQSGSARLEESFLAAEAGRRPQALQALLRARALGLDAEDQRRADELEKKLYGSGPALTGPLSLAEMAARSGKRQDAVRHLKQAEAQASDLETARRIAFLYGSLGEDGRSKALLEKAAARWPQSASVLMDLADSAAKSKKPQAALDYLERAGAALRDDAEKRRLAMIHQNAGRLNEAVRLLSELAAAHPSQASVLHDRGVCLFLQGKRDAAIADFRQALALDPHFETARRSLDAVLGRRTDSPR